nr:hypothetical protein [Pseudoxanthomonas sp.]
MRDEKDPGTLEMVFPRRRGRPPLHGVAMSAAERARNYRANRRHRRETGSRVLHVQTDTTLLDKIRDAISSGRSPATIGRLVAELSVRYPAAD